MTTSYKNHWNKMYANNLITQLSWYEEEPYPSIQLIEKCAIKNADLIIDIGSGTSTLIPTLLELGYKNICAVDISDVALEKARKLLGERNSEIRWIVDDITNPAAILDLQDVGVWHDRAVFHFLTAEDQRQAYLSTLRKLIKPGGYAIIATFSVDAPDMCSGLPVQRYTAQSLQDILGDGFQLVESLNYTYTQPSGDIRPYIYTRFKKMDN